VTQTVADAEAVGVAMLVALIVCCPAAAGGAYTPVAEIVPTAAFPLATPSTDQATLPLVVFVPPEV